MKRMLIFGPGYVASRFADRLAAEGWSITRVHRTAGPNAIAVDDTAAVCDAIALATHILSSVPPEGGRDDILDRYGAMLPAADARWIGYLSSTGVYGDTGGAWVDESAPVGGGRRSARSVADHNWRALGSNARIFRLPGIYGPGRSPFARLTDGTATRVDAPGQLFSRIHVDDIVEALILSLGHSGGVLNLADDLPASGAEVTAYAACLLGIAPPPLVPVSSAALSPAARAFYSENRRVANGKAKRLLDWRPRFPTYIQGLRACLAAERGLPPASTGG